MSMRMNIEDLVKLADMLRELEKTGFDIVKLRMPPHVIYLCSATDGSLIVRGITDKTDEDDESPISRPVRR